MEGCTSSRGPTPSADSNVPVSALSAEMDEVSLAVDYADVMC